MWNNFETYSITNHNSIIQSLIFSFIILLSLISPQIFFCLPLNLVRPSTKISPPNWKRGNTGKMKLTIPPFSDNFHFLLVHTTLITDLKLLSTYFMIDPLSNDQLSKLTQFNLELFTVRILNVWCNYTRDSHKTGQTDLNIQLSLQTFKDSHTDM